MDSRIGGKSAFSFLASQSCWASLLGSLFWRSNAFELAITIRELRTAQVELERSAAQAEELVALREQIEALDGTFTNRSRPRGGTIVEAYVPVQQHSLKKE